MSLDRTHTLQSLTDDILAEVENRESLEKTAAEGPKFAPRTKLGQELLKISAELKKLASSKPDVTYADLEEFKRRMAR